MASVCAQFQAFFFFFVQHMCRISLKKYIYKKILLREKAFQFSPRVVLFLFKKVTGTARARDQAALRLIAALVFQQMRTATITTEGESHTVVMS